MKDLPMLSSTISPIADAHSNTGVAPLRGSSRPFVLFVDDDEGVRASLKRLLHGAQVPWDFEFASDVELALKAARARTPDVVVTDVHMPGRDGFELIQEFQASPMFRCIPIIVVTGAGDSSAKRRALNLGAIDLLCKPVSGEDLLARVSSGLRIKISEDALRDNAKRLDEVVKMRTRQLEIAQLDVIIRLATAGEYRDSDTGLHVIRVGNIARILAASMGLPADVCDRLFVASMLHDIGKVGVPDGILRKPGALTPQEREVMQTHCEIGYAILCGKQHPCSTFLHSSGLSIGDTPLANEWLETAGRIALYHHERWDGTGYPAKLAGENIPLEARIVSVADVIDALSSERPYKRALSMSVVFSMIGDAAGTQFDPEVVRIAERCWTDICSVSSMFRERPKVERAAA